MMQWLLVGAGGFAGSVLRFGLSGLVQRALPNLAFPAGTLAVNVVGCIAIGWLAAVAGRHPIHPSVQLFLFIGVLGGFTTYSAFGNETVTLIREAAWLRAFLNVALHIGVGFAAVIAGHLLGRA